MADPAVLHQFHCTVLMSHDHMLSADVVCLCGVCRKSFIETRSMGAVAVAFSRVYILHAILMCWMSLLVS
jgi:hypothetical protein